jgi:DnaJ-like protein
MHAYRPDHYEALGVPRDADVEAIRAAWRTQAMQLHPDLADDGRTRSGEAFLRLKEAYDVLRDPVRRARYDATLARQAEAARRPIYTTAAPRTTPRGAAPRSATPRGAPPRASVRMSAAPPRRQPPATLGLDRYFAAIALVVLVTAGIAAWQILLPPEPTPIALAAVEHISAVRPARASAATEPGSVIREADRAVQAQIERVEAAKKQLEARLGEFDARKPAPAPSPAPLAKPPAMVAEQVQCIGRGTAIVLIRDKESARVSYDNGPQVHPRISDLGTGLVLVSRIEPTNKIAIGFTKGDRSATTLLMFDEAGKVQQTFNVECTVAAF